MSHFKGPDIAKVLHRFRPHTSFLQVMLEALRNNGNATALVEGQSGKSASYADILQHSTSIAAGLHNAGVAAGNFVVLCCEKGIISYSLLLGTMLTGASAVLCPPGNANIIDRLTKGFSVKAVFFDTAFSEPVKRSLKNISPSPSLIGTTSLEDPVMAALFNTSKEFNVFKVTNVRQHVSVVMFSSGTTGEPKGIQITDIALQLMGYLFSPQVDNLLTASPFYWYSGIFTFVSCIFNKYILTMSNSRQGKENLQVVEKYQVDGWFISVGAMIQYPNEHNIKDYNLTSVKKLFTGGELVLTNVAEAFINNLMDGRVPLEVLYGTTEAGILTTYTINKNFGNIKLGLCGQLNPGKEMKIVDDEGSIVAPGCVGELWMKSIGMTPGYWGRPDLNSKLFDKEGFFHSGDAAFFDNDGNLYLRGRIIDLINYKGYKFSPAEAENILMSHPAVLDAVVVGRSHPKDIQHATAFIVRKPGSTVSEEEIAAFVNGKVDDKEWLRGGVHLRDSLPRVAVGKVTRKELKTADC